MTGAPLGDQDAAAPLRGQQTIDIYNTQAETLLPVYRGLGGKSDAPNWWRFVPTGPTDAADIGAGFGFDARRLAAAGHRVVAVEPSEGMRQRGQELDVETGASLRWLDSRYPELEGLRVLGISFDFIMSTAVWMHLAPEERAVAMASVAALLAPGGRFVLTVRHGPPPKGRPMFDVPAEEAAALGDDNGLTTHWSGRVEDGARREGVWWFRTVLDKPTGG